MGVQYNYSVFVVDGLITNNTKVSFINLFDVFLSKFGRWVDKVVDFLSEFTPKALNTEQTLNLTDGNAKITSE